VNVNELVRGGGEGGRAPPVPWFERAAEVYDDGIFQLANLVFGQWAAHLIALGAVEQILGVPNNGQPVYAPVQHGIE